METLPDPSRSRKARTVAALLGAAALVLGLVLVPVARNWRILATDLSALVGRQSQAARTTLFRLGEVGSISAELEAAYDTEAEVTYVVGSRGRTLGIVLSDYQPPSGVPARDHARELAVFALEKTKKSRDVDAVEVLLPSGVDGAETFVFSSDEVRAVGAG